MVNTSQRFRNDLLIFVAIIEMVGSVRDLPVNRTVGHWRSKMYFVVQIWERSD
jgi:hypothetical protein